MDDPGRMVCPSCMEGRRPESFDDELHAWLYECPECVGVEGPYQWFVDEPRRSGSTRGRTGIMADLGMYDAVVEAAGRIPDRWLEFGVLEALFAEVAHEAFLELVETYGHVALGPDTNTASWMIGRATWVMAREGALAAKPTRATGRWGYLSSVNAWSIPGRPTNPEVLTWEAFAVDRGRDPNLCWYVPNAIQ